MASVTLYIPGADVPVRTTEAARLRRIQAKAKGSESVVRLMCDLAFGPHPDLGWLPATRTGYAEIRFHG